MKSVNQQMQWFGVESCAGRVKYDDPRMYHFRSWEPQTPFAPRFDCPMWLDQVEPEKCKKILEQWEEEKRPWATYNFFDEQIENNLLPEIHLMTGAFCDILEVEMPEKLWIRGWIHKLTVGQHLPTHHHSIHENTFLSGNMLLTHSKTPTEYYIPGYSLYGGNLTPAPIPGMTTIFPSWVEHRVGTVSETRIALAWDIYTQEAMDYCKKSSPSNEMMMSIPFE